MKTAFLAVVSTYLATLALSLGTSSAQAPVVNLTGTWNGTGTDYWVRSAASDGMTVTWVLTQTGSTVSGTVRTGALNPSDGSCSSCHRAKSGTVSGTVSGTALTLTMEFPGNNGEVTSACTANFTGAATIADTAFTTSYSGVDSCEGAFQSGTLAMAREPATPPSITSQPASQLIPTGQSVGLIVTGAGTAPLSYQWYRGTRRTTSDPIVGAVLGSYTTPAVTIASNYWVRVSNAYGSTVDSDTARLTPYLPFADDVLTSGTSAVRAAHIVELRARIDAVRARFGLAAYPYADASVAAGTTTIRARHIIDLRTALSEAYLAAGRPTPTYTDSSLAPGAVIKRAHIAELRAAVALIE